MELTNEFVIDRDVEETWTILNDLEFIAPCMPGAQLTEIEGDEYRGLVKIKVGPITANYKGKASFVEQDATNKVAKLKAEGRDPRQGNANAMVTAKMEAAGAGQTTVNIHTDLGLSGKIASFGRGAIEDVSKKILGQFTENLREKLESGADGADSADSASAPSGNGDASVPTAPTPASSSATAPAATSSSPASPSSGAASGQIRKIDGPEAEPVDLMDVAGGSVAKRALPAVGGLALVALILYWLLGRG
ncbi:MAG: SRPBCC family protein [Acidimicrobiales bacterium]